MFSFFLIVLSSVRLVGRVDNWPSYRHLFWHIVLVYWWNHYMEGKSSGYDDHRAIDCILMFDFLFSLPCLQVILIQFCSFPFAMMVRSCVVVAEFSSPASVVSRLHSLTLSLLFLFFVCFRRFFSRALSVSFSIGIGLLDYHLQSKFLYIVFSGEPMSEWSHGESKESLFSRWSHVQLALFFHLLFLLHCLFCAFPSVFLSLLLYSSPSSIYWIIVVASAAKRSRTDPSSNQPYRLAMRFVFFSSSLRWLVRREMVRWDGMSWREEERALSRGAIESASPYRQWRREDRRKELHLPPFLSFFLLLLVASWFGVFLFCLPFCFLSCLLLSSQAFVEWHAFLWCSMIDPLQICFLFLLFSFGNLLSPEETEADRPT